MALLYDSSGEFFTHEKKPSTEGGAALVGIVGLTFALAASAASPGGTTAAIEFTPVSSKRFKDEPGNWAYFTFGRDLPLKVDS